MGPIIEHVSVIPFAETQLHKDKSFLVYPNYERLFYTIIYMLLLLAFVLLAMYCVFTQCGVIKSEQRGGSATGQEEAPQATTQEEAPQSKTQEAPQSTTQEEAPQAATIEDIAKVLEKKDIQVAKATNSLVKINDKLDHHGELDDEEHQKLQKIAQKTKNASDTIIAAEQSIRTKMDPPLPDIPEELSKDDIQQHPWLKLKYDAKKDTTGLPLGVDDHIKLTKDVLNNHNERLMQLDKYLCQLKKEVDKNQSILSDIKHKLQNTITKVESTGPSPIKDREELSTKKEKIDATTKVIAQNCPVCPLYAQTTPVNIMDITGHGL